MSSALSENKGNLKTVLYDLHEKYGAKFVEFAGYDMPVQYPLGVLGEHLHVRSKMGLFDVSHMGQVRITAKLGSDAAQKRETLCHSLEKLIPADLRSLTHGSIKYNVLLNEMGGIIDDLLITSFLEAEEPFFYMVINASRKDVDLAYLKTNLGQELKFDLITDHSLLALQGPMAADLVKQCCAEAAHLKFMQGGYFYCFGHKILVSRTGYTGEDGFEISIPNEAVLKIAEKMLMDENLKLIGLGARDSLRLEAGLSLYGHDLDEQTNPVEAGLTWIIPKVRREQGGFLGYSQIQSDLTQSGLTKGPAKKRVGLKPTDKIPAREHTKIYDESGTQEIGIITSGGFSPSLSWPIAMGVVQKTDLKVGDFVMLEVRGKKIRAEIVNLPFVPHRYHKG